METEKKRVSRHGNLHGEKAVRDGILNAQRCLKKYLGEQIDIHAGGEDLIFPHHENEIAQSEAANGKEFAKYWMHNGFLNIDNRKMSKSLGNFFTVREISEKI